jgi:hypothetical protein
MYSGMAPVRVDTTGKPLAIASRFAIAEALAARWQYEDIRTAQALELLGTVRRTREVHDVAQAWARYFS